VTIIVSPLSYVELVARTRRPSHVITLLDPEHEIPTPEGVEPARHLRLGCWDVSDDSYGLTPPDEAIVRQVVEFGRGWTGDEPILVHCWAGISRSTASAFTLACERNPDTPELEIARDLRARSRVASPNLRIVALADDLLGRSGRMVEAVEAIGRGDPAHENRPFEIPARW
jgi:predicted protein tyrosine phosphatase